MYTKNELIKNLSEMEIHRTGTLLVHSSMKAIGEVDGGAAAVLDALSEYMKDGLLVFPTHTWSEVGSKKDTYDSRVEPSCVGLLSNMFMSRPGVVRSLHPTHSVAALGNNAELYISGEELSTTPCPRNGCWGKLYDMDAQIMFLGCSLRSNTFIHGVEEWNHIPDRISEWTQRIRIIDRYGKEFFVDMHRHHGSITDPSENYDKMQPVFEYLHAIRYGKFGDADCIIGNARQMAWITASIVSQMPQLFSNDNPVPEEKYK